MNRLSTLLQRFIEGRRHGVFFFGTSYFKCPDRFLINGKWFDLSHPSEIGTSYDFTNVVLDDEYGLSTLPFGTPETIVDIGANFGLFSVLACGLFPNARINSYEPNFRSFEHAERNLNLFPNATIYQEALGLRTGRADLIDVADSRMAKTVVSEVGSIEIVPFSTAVSRLGEIDLLKLDAEGAEWEILQDIASLQHVRLLRMEYHLMRGKTFQELEEILFAANFKITHHYPNKGFGIVWAQSSNF